MTSRSSFVRAADVPEEVAPPDIAELDGVEPEVLENGGTAEGVVLSVDFTPLLAGQQEMLVCQRTISTMLLFLVLFEVIRLSRGLSGQVFGRRR